MSAAAAILRLFASLTATATGPSLDAASGERPFAWLGLEQSLFARSPDAAPTHLVLDDRPGLAHLATLDSLHRHERVLREGWVFLAGRVERDGTTVDLLHPLVSRPVHLTRRVGGVVLTVAGDRALTPLVPGGPTRAALEGAGDAAPPPSPVPPGFPPRGAAVPLVAPYLSAADVVQLPWLHEWIRAVAAEAGLPVDVVVGPTTSPLELRGRAEVSAVIGSGLFLARDLEVVDRSTTLGSWSVVPGIEDTAFAAAYGIRPPRPPARSGRRPVRSVLPLTARQREVIVRTRAEDLVVVSGPPGNGKSHTVVAAAMDAVDRGASVLVATRTDHATDALTDLLRRHPGPDPVLFGDAEQRDQLAGQLLSGLGVPLPDAELVRRRAAVDRLETRVRRIESAIAHELRLEAGSEELVGPTDELTVLLALVPGAFAAGTDIDALLALAGTDAAPGPAGLPWPEGRLTTHLQGELGTARDVPLTTIRRALLAARARRRGVALAPSGAAITSAWDELARADAELALGVGSLVADRVNADHRLTPASRAAVGALATALRSDRPWRRMHLQSLDGSSLLQALPLWIGTLRDIDDLLPEAPRLFDLVILDEAAQIDPADAALALLRGDRALVVGDPRQLRHESVIDELEAATAIDEHQLAYLGGRLDPDNSAFDVAAAAAPVTWLDEHFRSAPHLIHFSAERFYPEPFQLLTRHPRNETEDVIDTVRVDGHRGDDGVNLTEVEAVRSVLAGAIDRGWTSLGVLSPVPEQAAALVSSVVAELPREQLAAIDLQVGGIERFQGHERDLMILSLAIDEQDVERGRDGGALLRDIEDPNRFNVMITRARSRLVVVTSVADAGDGVLGDYLRDAEQGPPPMPAGRARHRWIAALADELTRLDVAVRPEYPVGQWTIDLCVGDDDRAMAVECVVHPAGPAVHIERHRVLARAGWRSTDCFASRWDGDAVSAAVALATELRRDRRR